MCVEHYQFKYLDSKLILKISTLYQFMCCGLKAYLKDMRFAPSSCVVDLKLILKIYDPVKSAQSALVEGALPYDGSGEHHEWTSASHPSNGTGA